jgi:hypothetical protein
MVSWKIVYNNWFLEKGILEPIKAILKCQNSEEILTYVKSYMKDRVKLTIWEYTLLTMFIDIDKNNIDIGSGEYVWFFNEIHFLDKFKPSFKMLIGDDFLLKLKWLIELYWRDNLKHILYFYIFFKTKKFIAVKKIELSTDNNIPVNIRKDNNIVVNIDKQDFAFIEVSRIVWRLKTIEVHSFYRDNLLNNKLKTYFTSLSLWFKKINYHTNISSDSMLLSENINPDKQNLFIVEKYFREKHKAIFENWNQNYVIVIEKYLVK